ncbi:hypothetical protein QQP08_000272 [Theobroma cacao]|nr:hypothetical protein QQP08_000272 [Theobroma cacao]
MLRQEVDRAKSEKKSISPEVESWLAEVDAFVEPISRFINDVESRKHLCDPMARYSLSHKSVEMIRQLVERHEEGMMFQNVTDPAPPPRIGSTFIRVLNPKFSTPN